MPNDYSDLGKPVEISEIDRELKLLWEADDAQTNASLMNFVIYSEEPRSLRESSELAHKLTQEHACRAILVEIDRTIEEPSISAYITAHCHVFSGNKSVCHEQIAFYMTGTAYGRLSNTVFAHTASDLPLAFWWRGELNHVFNERLTSVIDRLIIDSADFKNAAVAHNTLAEALNQQSFIVQDLAWTRISPFRLSFAKLFDEPIAQSCIDGIHSVSFTYQPKHSVSVALMLSWIAKQAGWKLSGNMNQKITAVSASGKPIAVHLEADEASAPIGSVEVSGCDFSLSLYRAVDDGLIHEKLSSGKHCVEGVSPYGGDSAVDLVANQLARGGANRLYLAVLPILRSIL